MLMGCSLETIDLYVGHHASMTALEISRVLRRLHYLAPEKLQPITTKLPASCMLWLVPAKGGKAHWVCRVEGRWHDPMAEKAGKPDGELRGMLPVVFHKIR